MIHEIDCDLLKCDLVDAFVHQANCFHTMGSGIARQIKEIYPELYAADCASGKSGDSKRMGTFSCVKCHDNKWGYNLYGQFNYGTYARQTSYDAVDRGFRKILVHATDNSVSAIGMPKNMGCALGGGDWRIVRAIVESVFDNTTMDVYICNYTPKL